VPPDAAPPPEAPAPRIRSIVLEAKPIFGPDEKLDQIPLLPDLTFIFDLANFLHIDTREHVIRRELLFHEGDPADPKILAETERNLRDLRFIRAVRVYTRPAEGGDVDVVVETQDTWTTAPRLSLGGGGGTKRFEIGVIERNLAGYGKKVALLYRQSIDRNTSLFGYEDPRILGSHFHAAGDYQDTSDGRVVEGQLDYPFYSLETPWSGGTRYENRKERNKIFDHFGREISRFRRDQQSVFANVAHRLPIDSPDVVHRLGLFYRRVEDDFPVQAPDRDPALIPTDRLQSEPGLSYHREVVRFVQERHFDLFDKIEDFNLGNTFDLQGGYSTRALGARVDEPIVAFSDRQGFDLGPGRKVFLFGLVSGREQASDIRNGVVEVEGISYQQFRLFFEQTLVTRLKLDLARNLDTDTQLFLGSFNGLRGFRTRALAGEKRFIFNLEDRMFFVNDLFHLVSFGAVMFFDTGYVWDRNQTVDFRDLASGVGIGLRIGLPRAAGEVLFRLDLAFPVKAGGTGETGPGVTFGAGQGFSAFSGPFDLQTTSGD
jgi:outer membrane protein assembly factor BamA